MDQITTSEDLTDLKVLSLEIQDFMRIKAIKLVPDPKDPLVLITGENGVGKTTIIDAMWCGFGGKKVISDIAPGSPVRDGAEEAEIVLNLGDIIITRRFTTEEVGEEDDKRLVYKDSGLVVTNADGTAEFKKPQQLLTALLGRFTLDLTTFLDAPPKDQLDTVLDLAGKTEELAELDARRLELYDKRTGVNSARDNAKAAADEIEAPDERPEVPEVKEILEQRRARETEWRETVSVEALKGNTVDEASDAVNATQQEITLKDALVKNLDGRIKEIRAELEQAEADAAQAEKERGALIETLEDQTATLRGLPGPEVVPDPDYADLDEQIAGVGALQALATAFDDRTAKLKTHTTQDAASKAITTEIKKIDKEEKPALVAGAKLPVEGLGFGEDGLTWVGEDGQEHPLAQEGMAVQLVVAMNVAMAEDTGIKVIRIDDGERFDSKNMALIREMAAEKGYQVWMARVDETGEVGFVIEDGALAA